MPNRETPALVHPPRPGRTPARRATVGFVADAFTDYYQLSLLDGAMQAAQERMVNLIAVASGVPETRRPEAGLVGRVRFDTLVGVASTMAYAIGLDGIADYFAALDGLPTCFIGGAVPGSPSISIDNRSGMEQAVTHLTRVHEKRRVAFVGGPVGQSEAETRLAGYREVLETQGIPFDPRLVAHGDFMRHSGHRAMLEILGRGHDPDAVVAANDMMAFGALEALRERGFDVPAKVALVGFDDSEEGQFSVPSLTSVRQPLGQLGREAVRVAMARKAGEADVRSVAVNLELMVRSSCGCKGGASGLASAQSVLRDVSFEAAFAERRPLIVAEVSRAAQAALGRLSTGWVDRLLQAFVDDMRGIGGERFRQVLTEEVTRSRQSRGQLRHWQRVVSVMRNQSRPCFGQDLRRLEAAEALWHMAREVLAEEMQNDQAMRRLRTEHWVRGLRESSITLGRCRSLDGLLTALIDHLDRLGFRRAYLALTQENPAYSRLVLGYDRDLPVELQRDAPVFATSELVPSDWLDLPQPSVWVLLPLMVDRTCRGHLVLDPGPGEGSVWEGLRQQVASALLCADLRGW
jgi:sigma-B regulation protein RsbU (phosphoserine phosphatase)